MPHFLVSYDLNGSQPTHSQVDDHLSRLSGQRGRVLETVWYVQTTGTPAGLRDYMDRLLTHNDQVVVVEIVDAAWRNLLVGDNALKNALLRRA